MEHEKNVDAIRQSEKQTDKSDYDIISDFRTKTEKLFNRVSLYGMSPSSIEKEVKENVLKIVRSSEKDVIIEEVIVSGSRCRGLENVESDLDVVVFYSGSEREDSFFNLIHEDRMFIEGVEIDINPINTKKTGTIAEYLLGVEKYLWEKAKTSV